MPEAKTASLSFETGMLAYARSIQITEGLFHALRKEGDEERRSPIEVREKGVRGQSSEDNAKNPGLSNPQAVEHAIVPPRHHAVELEFGLRVMPLAMKPHACGATDVGDAYRAFAARYRDAGGFRRLAELYVWNIANARFAWRNRFQSDEMSVRVAFHRDETIRFNPFALDLDKPATIDQLASAMIEGESAQLEALIAGFAEGLARKPFAATVTWRASMSPGQEIFPSQEYLREEAVKNAPSRVLAKLPTLFGGREVMQASMHSQKIGAALRHIDVWHGDANYSAIAVNPYGGVQETGAVLRAPKTKRSFYDLRKRAEQLMEGVPFEHAPERISEDAHFVMANLVRGGVFGSTGKSAKSATEA